MSERLKRLIAAQQANESCAWAPWSLAESRLRDILHEYDQHKVLHFTDVGHVLLESHNCRTAVNPMPHMITIEDHRMLTDS